MKAILHTKYGPPNELQLREVEDPVPEDNEVRIRIRASTVTSSDCNLRDLTFAPKSFSLPMRLQLGLIRPKNQRTGLDLTGEVDAIGKDVSRFVVGDEVFGSAEPRLGAHAEYVCVPEDGPLAKKPTNATWEEAACLPLAGITALYFIRDQGMVQPGQKVLIHGASGGIGTFAVQLAKHYGAEVTGVCSASNVEMVRSLGADRVIDYTRDDFAEADETYDVIFDVVGRTSYSHSKNLLKKDGLYLVTLPRPGILLQMQWEAIIGAQRIRNGTKPANAEDLVFLKELTEAGKLKAVIDSCYPLSQTAEAFSYVEKGHKRGNVVITIASDEKALELPGG